MAVSIAYFVWGLEAWGRGPEGLPLGTLLAVLGVPFFVLILPAYSLARLRTEEVLIRLVRPLWVLSLPLRPVGHLLATVEDRLERIFHETEEDEEEEDREEIIAAVADGEHEGVVEEGEREMIVNIFDLRNSDLSDIMTPRTDICAIHTDATVEEAVRVALEKGFSRLPVYAETRDNIKGIFHVKDALNRWQPGEDGGDLAELLRPPIFVPETKKVGEFMRELQEKKMHMAVVLDEYGGTAGLATIEDVVEEIVGEIQDEHDPEEHVLVRPLEEDSFDVDARTHVHDMNEALGEKLLPEDGDFETIGGFILDHLGRIPAAKETFSWDGLAFTVVSSDERKIDRVRVERLLEEEEDEKAAAAPLDQAVGNDC
jgi:CBS domain containing-hemolysin-like protein